MSAMVFSLTAHRASKDDELALEVTVALERLGGLARRHDVLRVITMRRRAEGRFIPSNLARDVEKELVARGSPGGQIQSDAVLFCLPCGRGSGRDD